ncbi:hypothetical protein [Nodularia chucula]|uniref:hypothetical protein n=1 Tax=Nodularia chucula TaxID=3093667 RepID=UPI0039C6BCFC
MSKSSLFPAWLPKPKSWLMAVRLAIPAYFGATVVLAFEFWRYAFLGSLLAVTSNNGLIPFFVFSVIALVLALIWFLILTGVYKLLLKLLWSNPPQWLRLPTFKSLVIRDFGILVLSLVPILIIFTIYILFVTSYRQTFNDFRTPRLTYDIFLLRFFWLWFISTAYLYELSTRKNIVRDKANKLKNP